MNTKKAQYFYIKSILYIVVIILVIYILYVNLDKINTHKKQALRDEVFDNITLDAKSVYVFDSKENKVLFERNSRIPLPLASITKVASVGCSLDKLDIASDVIVTDSVYSYNDNATSTGKTEVWSVEDLAVYTLITSSNTGATLLSKYTGGEDGVVSCMNDYAQVHNLFETTYANVTGLDIDESTPGSIGSAENVVTMFRSVFAKYPDILEKTSYTVFNIYSKNGIIHKAINTNLAADKITGFMGSKTGLTDLAGGNLVFVMNVGLDHRIYVAILGSTEEGRFSDALKLSGAVLKTLSN